MTGKGSRSDRRRYRTPPIEEAVCEFRFRPGPVWDLTIPGKLHTRLAEEYPGKPREQTTTELTVEGSDASSGGATIRQGITRVQLATADRRRLVSVGRDVLSVHMLKPYQREGEPGGWEEFRPRIERAVAAYWGVARPTGVSWIALRYINRITPSGGVSETPKFVRCAFEILPDLPAAPRQFLVNREYAYDDGVHLNLRYGTAGGVTDPKDVYLDIEVVWEHSEALGEGAAVAKMDLLRARERRIFEALVTDSARGLFDAV